MKTTNRKFLAGILLVACGVYVFSLPAAAATNSNLSGTYFAGEMRAGTEFVTSLIQYDCDGNGALTRQILAQSAAGAASGALLTTARTHRRPCAWRAAWGAFRAAQPSAYLC